MRLAFCGCTVFVALLLGGGCGTKRSEMGGPLGGNRGGPDAGDGGGQADGQVDGAAVLLAPTEVLYLSGHGNDDAIPWDFYCASTLANNRNCTGTATSGTWSTIPVPSNWELQGFGTYYYGTDNGFLRGQETGHYRLSFEVPAAWNSKRVFVVFEGSMTDTDVTINGMSAGPVHQGAFYRFKYDISSLLHFGDANLLEAAVSKESANPAVSSAERSADYWVFGGIFRPVYLEAYPDQFIERVAADARADGGLSLLVALQGVTAADQVKARILDSRGAQVGPALSTAVTPGQGSVSLSAMIPGVAAWSAETPNLYRLEVTLEQGGQSVHQVAEAIGFRTIEVRPGNGLYINGKRAMLRGINRHSFWPTTGRTTSAKLSHDDIVLLKGMNVNAVRSSHYPPDRHFLEAADSMGLYVLDELAGWQHAYDTAGGTPLVKEMVTFDANHPSIIAWDNGNEGGWNTALDDDFGQWDPQHRVVLHPQQLFGNVQANHYPNYAAVQAALAGPNIFMPTEFLHGLYDGGGGAGLDDYWTIMRASPRSAGGFLWALLDEGVVRTDDPLKRIDTKGNQAPDGVVGPYREKEGSYNSIREIWSPVQITLNSMPDSFAVENRYDFVDMNTVLFHWQLVDFDFTVPEAGHRVVAGGTARTGSIQPGAMGTLSIADMPPNWADHHAILLGADDPTGQTVGQWSWMIATPQRVRETLVAPAGPAPATCGVASDGTLTVAAGGTSYTFSTTTGLLAGVSRNGAAVALQNGPALTTGSGATLASGNGMLQSFDAAQQGNDCVLTATYAGNLSQLLWQVMSSGWLRLTYRYVLTGAYDFFGVSFDYPESRVQSAQWLGKGPYRVWRNRLKGTTDDVWTRSFNDSITGGTWNYPEFKGYFADVEWARLFTSEGIIHLVFDSPPTFLRLYSARDGASPQTTQMVFPPPTPPSNVAGISFLQGIPAIGTKFDASSALGPASQPYQLQGELFEGTVYLFIGEISELPPVAR